MANGFYLNGTACGQIGAERRTLRHLSNSLRQAQPNSAQRPRLFGNTAWVGKENRVTRWNAKVVHEVLLAWPGTAGPSWLSFNVW
jgi:hypothetical protein